MTIHEHEARCSKVLYVDLTALEVALRYGGKARLYCIDGHSAYRDVAPLPAAIQPRQDYCAAEGCMTPIPADRMFCGPCALRKRQESTPQRRCAGCHQPMQRSESLYHDAWCKAIHRDQKRAKKATETVRAISA